MQQEDSAVAIRQMLKRYGDTEVGAARLLCDCHPVTDVALSLVSGGGDVKDVTFGELRDRSGRIATVLRESGIGPGDRVASMMGKSLDLVALMIAIWRLGAVYVPLFTAFGSDAAAERLTATGARAVVTDRTNAPKLSGAHAGDRVVLDTDTPDDRARIDAAAPIEGGYEGGGRWPIVHMLTSGTTGPPKGVVHDLEYLAGWDAYLRFALDLRSDDAYWCAADPGWAYGLYSTVITPLALGIRTIVQVGNFSVDTAVAILRDQAITNLAAAPTVYRALRAAEIEPGWSHLRVASSAGEPLPASVSEWAADALGIEIRDHYGQTELGMVAGNVHHPGLRRPVKPGSMGASLPGWSVVVLRMDTDELAPAGETGRMAIDVTASPFMTFRGYQPPSSDRFSADRRFYVTGDTGAIDADGDITFSGRDDDLIIMAGYRISPSDIESILLRHPRVADCAVIAVPDELRGEVIEAVIVLTDGAPPSPDLSEALREEVRRGYGAHAYPRRLSFVPSLPRTPSGKLQRFVLRSQRESEVDPSLDPTS
jgi:acetyl-CoA synthetase